MTKHPIITAFVVALVLSVVLAVVLPYSTQESPWALFFIVVLFPFIWFFAWVIINALAWWQDTMASAARSGSADDENA
jgi:hypothetical protein